MQVQRQREGKGIVREREREKEVDRERERVGEEGKLRHERSLYTKCNRCEVDGFDEGVSMNAALARAG